MTKWEIGQDLVKLFDKIGLVENDLLIDEHHELAEELRKIRYQVGSLFNDNNDHGFDLPNTKDNL